MYDGVLLIALGSLLERGGRALAACATLGAASCVLDATGPVQEEICKPGDVIACYSGPAATSGKGACREGTRACASSGAEYGPCQGEVVPIAESCTTKVDDDCDGTENEGCLCFPAEPIACYTGAPGTEGHGACTGGTAICDEDGQAYGACFGQVVPGPENCASGDTDEDCNDVLEACTAEPQWAEKIESSPRATLVLGMAARGTDEVAVVGLKNGGADPLLEGDVFVQVRNASGEQLFEVVSTAPPMPATTEIANAVAVDDAGAVYVTGELEGEVSFGGATLPAAGGPDLFVLKLAPDGAIAWQKRFGDASPQAGLAIAVRGGRVYVAGRTAGTLDLGSIPSITSAGASDAFLAVLDAGDGSPLELEGFGDVEEQSATTVDVDPQGNVLLGGEFRGTITLDGTTALSATDKDIFVARLGPTLQSGWSKQFGGAGDQTLRRLVLDGSGNILVAGQFTGALGFGGSSLAITDEGGYVAKLDATGAQRWTRFLDSPGSQRVLGLAVDRFGNVLVGGVFEGTLTFGSAALATVLGDFDAFYVKLDGKGSHVLSKQFGEAQSQLVLAVAAGADASAFVGGHFQGDLAFGDDLLENAAVQALDGFAARLAP